MRQKLLALAGVWLIQAVPVIVLAPALVSEGTDEYLSALSSPDYWVGIAIAGAVVAALQAIFLWPVRRPSPANAGRGLWPSIVIAAAACALLTGALLAALYDVAWLLDLLHGDLGSAPAAVSAIGLAVVVAWLVWLPIVGAFCDRSRRESALGHLSARLLLGTVVEVVAITPLYVMVRRRTSCFCGAGTFIALVACLGAGWLALGPAVFLPMLAARRKRWYAGHCDACGYDMSGCSGAPRCPECGAGWRAA